MKENPTMIKNEKTLGAIILIDFGLAIITSKESELLSIKASNTEKSDQQILSNFITDLLGTEIVAPNQWTKALTVRSTYFAEDQLWVYVSKQYDISSTELKRTLPSNLEITVLPAISLQGLESTDSEKSTLAYLAEMALDAINSNAIFNLSYIQK